MPEPPLNLTAESGPQASSVLLTWLPVTITSSGLSNGVQVAGYQVMADGKRKKLVPGATCMYIIVYQLTISYTVTLVYFFLMMLLDI